MTEGCQERFSEQSSLTLSVGQVSRLLQISRNSAYEGVRSGQIPSIKIGNRILIPRARLMRMLGEDTETPFSPTNSAEKA